MLQEAIAFEAHPVSPSFLARIVAPYKPTNTDYLREAHVVQRHDPADDDLDPSTPETPIATTVGHFKIPSSCYIQSTGHFNAVEYLICFNQLAYTTLGHLIDAGILAELPSSRVSSACRAALENFTIDIFFSKQLSSMLILKTETRFTKAIDPNDFQGELAFKSVFYRNRTLFAQTTCRFTDKHGGNASGTVLLALPVNFN